MHEDTAYLIASDSARCLRKDGDDPNACDRAIETIVRIALGA